MDILQSAQVAVAFVFLIGVAFLQMGLLGQATADVQADMTPDSIEANLTALGLEAIETGGEKMGTIQTVGFAVLILAVISGAFLYGQSKKGKK